MRAGGRPGGAGGPRAARTRGAGGLTAFHSDHIKGGAGASVLQRVVREAEAGTYRPDVHRVFALDEIVTAHRHMEDDQAAGKLVTLP
ncbi:zinc-binding dehydrogenase [Streptomyces sp. NPDC059690]|uniref:zinc-binding dehydrogenase n=1 Tax=Streptomyces sp. NPDC059690 TaxID=3346907 RepID=UPI0036B7CC64